MKTDVVIIGGGLAGLTCAMDLLGSGLRVTVLERAGMLGGCASSWTDATTGDSISIGPHIFLNQYHNMFKPLDLLGTREQILWQRDRRFLAIVKGGRQTVIRNSRLPRRTQMISAYRRTSQAMPENIKRLVCQTREKRLIRCFGQNTA